MIGTKLSDRYEVVGELGRGGMGVVYRAKDPVLDRDVAVKVIPPTHVTAETEERFRREAQLVAQMDHPGIVPIHDFGRHGDSLFLVMPVVSGTSLRAVLREGSLVLGDVIEIGIQAAEALQYSHARNVVHRDVKPENLMISRDDGVLRVRVMDFGLAMMASQARMTQTGAVVGTMGYLSPEQVLSRAVDHRTDIYSLGTVLYECLVGTTPFAGEMQSVLYRIVHDAPQSPRALGVEIDAELEAVFLSCLAREPSKRPQDAKALAEGLRRCRARLKDSDRGRAVAASASGQMPRVVPSPFVGREKEMAELQRRLDAATSGECQFVAIGGEPGCGKSRLLDEFEGLAKARIVRVLRGRFFEQNRSFPYQGFYEAIQECFRRKESSDSSGVPDLGDLWPDLVALFPMLAEMGERRGDTGGATRPSDAGAAQRPESRAQVYELLARTLLRIAGGKPLVLLFEDLHGGETSIDALQYIVPRLGPTPTLVVGTYRTTEIDKNHPLARMLDGFEGDRRFSSLTLGPLTASEHRLFLETLVGGSHLAPELVQRVHDRTEGNPFFTKELVRSLLDSGAIAKDDTGAWVLAGQAGVDEEALPATIQQAVEKRIQRLTPELREVLSVAAVIGKTLDYDDLEALAGDRDDLDAIADKLVDEGLLVEGRDARADLLSFSSAVVHDVLYGQISRRRRRTLHRECAERLEARHKGRLERVYPQLLWHFAEGDVPSSAVEFGLLHARRSLDTFSPEEAARAAKTVLDFLDEGEAGDREQIGEARLILARSYKMLGNADGALAEAESAARAFGDAAKDARVAETLLFACSVAWQARRAEDTSRLVARGIEVARAAGAMETLRELLGLGATLANFRGDYARGHRLQDEAESIVGASAAPRADREIPRGGTLVVGLPNPVRATEPAEEVMSDEAEVLSNAFETLVAADRDGNLVPSLCEKWESKDDGRTFALTLRRDVRFQDGAPMTSGDVKRSFERALRVGRGTRAALAAIDGSAQFARGEADSLRGVVVVSDHELEIHLAERLPIYSALLTDPGTAIARVCDPAVAGGVRVVGTGPFRVASQSAQRVILERSDQYWGGVTPRLDALEFRQVRGAAADAAGLRSGEIDVTRDLAAADIESLLAEPRFKKGLHEAARKSTCFLLFNCLTGPNASNAGVRHALAGVVRPQEMVWQSLGRVAVPATSLVPPGILGHDPGRRRRPMSREDATAALRASGRAMPVRLSAAVDPALRDRYRPLLDALVGTWKELGVEVAVVTDTMASYLAVVENPARVDLVVVRWSSDYDDPDGIAHALFDSVAGRLRKCFASPEVDQILHEARCESRDSARKTLYRQFEALVADQNVLVPLFYEVDRRIAGPRVAGLRLRAHAPYVNYAELGKAASAPADAAPADAKGILHVPLPGTVGALDPATSYSEAQSEVNTCVYETLTRDVGGARIVPWLAEEFHAEDGGRRHLFRIREDVRFHDGRALGVRDVRYSFERLLADRASRSRWLLKPIRGAREILAGETRELFGFRILSAREFAIDLDEPVSFLPAVLSYPSMSIVPEGIDADPGVWSRGGVGTGPYRVVRFEPGVRLELARNEMYWRPGYPKSGGLVFSFGVQARQILADFRSGRFSIASDLLPEDAEALRRDPRFAAGRREAPQLSTYFAIFNTRAGPFRDRALRERFVRAVNVSSLVRATLGRSASPAHGLIPPGLVGHQPDRASDWSASQNASLAGTEVEVTAAFSPVFMGGCEPLARELIVQLQRAGIRVRRVTETTAEYHEASQRATVDLVLGRWVGDFPDADTFVHGVLHSEEGFFGRLCGTPEIDRLVKQGRTETDPAVRHAIYGQIEQTIAKDALLLPLFHEQAYRFARPEVEGLTVTYWVPTVRYEELRVRSGGT